MNNLKTKFQKIIPFLLQISIKFGAVGLGIFPTRWLNQYLSSPQRADYADAIAYTTIAVSFVNFGISNHVQKFFTSKEYSHNLNQLFSMALVARIVTYFLGLLFILATFRLVNSEILPLIIGLYTGQFILLADTSFKSITDSYGNSWQFSITDFGSKFLLVATLYGAVLWNRSLSNLTTFVWLSILTYSIGFLVDFLWQKKHFKLVKFPIALFKKHSRSMIYLGVSAFLYALYSRFGIFLIDVKDYDAKNAFDNAIKIYEIATILPSLLVPILVSKIKQEYDTGENIHNAIKKYLNVFIGATLVVFGFAFLFSYPIAYIIGATKFPLTVPYFQVLSFGLIFVPFVWLFGQLSIIFNKEKNELISTLVNCVFGLSFMFLFNNFFGYVGILIAFVLTLIFDLITKLILFYRIKF
jgi:O-antigen/teichoic acid export membrane protein